MTQQQQQQQHLDPHPQHLQPPPLSSSASSSSSLPCAKMPNPTPPPSEKNNKKNNADEPSFLGGAPSATHLVVLVHGLWGQPAHMHSIAHSLRERYPADDTYLFCAKTMSGTRTYDGVAHGGERVCAEVEELMAAHKSQGKGNPPNGFSKISFIGYSMGGLVARYVIGLLEAKGVLAEMECMTFATFASPHLGARIPVPTFPSRIWNAVASTSIGLAGDHLFLNDVFRDTARPLLSVLADPSSVFMHGLRRFRRLTTYGNIINDRAVVWYSTAFSPTDPFADLSKVAVKYVEGYEGVVLQRDGGVVLRDAKGKKDRGKRRLFGGRKGKDKVVKKVTDDVEGAAGETTTTTKKEDDKKEDNDNDDSDDDEEDPYKASWPWSMRLRMVAIGMILLLWPIAIPLVGMGTTAANMASKRRMRRHDQGKDGVDTHSYRKLPLFRDTTTTSPPPPPPISSEEPSSSPSTPTDGSTTASLAEAFPSLNLPATQLEMIESLNALPWRKWPVWIRRHANTHEDVVVRNFGTVGTEGHVVLRHFAQDEFLA